MNPELIARLVKLVERTGDRIVLPDPQTGKAIVVMDLDAYERLCAAPVEASAAAPAVQEPVRATEEGPAAKVVEDKKIAQRSENPFKKRASQIMEKGPFGKAGGDDLTPGGRADKMNRDIGDWKPLQDRRRGEGPMPAERGSGPYEAVNVLEEEERFFLEPIE